MSRTYKQYPYSEFRKPKRNRANKYNSRPKAIPPDEWNDKHFDRESLQSFHVALRMLEKGEKESRILSVLRKRKLSYRDAKRVLKLACERKAHRERFGR